MSLILCIETGTDICSVGIAKDGELLSLRESDEGRDHARKVGVFVDELLRETGIAPDELDAVAVGKGPGSYTGLRIGVSFAKGLCYGLQLSVPEAEMLVGKTDFNIKPTNPQNNAYRCVLSSCAENSIYEVNEMLESCGFEPLGSSKLG